MRPGEVSGIVQSLSTSAAARSDSSALSTVSITVSDSVSTDASAPFSADTVSISNKSRLTTLLKQSETNSEYYPRSVSVADESRKISGISKTARSIGAVQIEYNMNGIVLVRFMDTANRLIYQVPSELMMRMAEAALKSNSSVNTKV